MEDSKSTYDLTTSNLVSHVCVPRSIGYICGTEWGKGRNGLGIQDWPDGSRYEGEFENGLKHRMGVYSWPNGEIYEGSFYKDYRHGKGTYTWPDGSKFTGKFYLNRKEGYGVQIFPDGSLFTGLYHADERFGPGVLTYADGRQDVGLWHHSRLLNLCTRLEDAFSLKSLPDFQPQSELQQGSSQKGNPQTVHPGPQKSSAINKDPLVFSTEEILKDERFIVPPDTLRYAADPDHLPLPPRLRRRLDELFFCGRVPEASEDTHTHTHTHRHTSSLPLQERMQDHINRHRCEAERVDWAVGAVLSQHREAFGPKGPLEQGSERLIEEAAQGDPQAVYRILRDGRIHPDVGDAQGHTALIAATVCCHNEVIHMLLDSGANVNKLNREGMSALAVCHVLYYPASSLHTTVAELRPKPNVPVPKALSLQAEEQRHEAGKDSTIYELPEQSHSANEEEAAQDHTQKTSEEEEFMTICVNEEACLTKSVSREARLTKGVNEEACLTKGVNEEACLTKGVNAHPNFKGVNDHNEYLDNEGLENEQREENNQEASHTDGPQREEPKQEASHTDGPQREEPKQEASHTDGPQREEPKQEASHTEGHQWEEPKQEASHTEGHQWEEPKQEASHTEGHQWEEPKQEASHTEGHHGEEPKQGFQKEGAIDKGFKGVKLVIETAEREGLMNEESEREGLVNEKSEREGLANYVLKREIMAELSVQEGLINKVMETGEPQTVTSTTSHLWEEPSEGGQRSQLEGAATGGHLALDLENSKRCLTADSALSLASFQLCAAEEASCPSGLLPPEGAPETRHKIGHATTQRSERWATLRLLLSRGADPNASKVPMPVLFLAIKAAHTQAIQLLLESGARTDICLPSELNGLYPLHVAAGLLGDEGPRITELLLHAVADPDVQARDSHVLFELDKNTPDPQAGVANKSGHSSGGPPLGPGPPPDGGRTPLHIACQRDHDYKNARDVVCVLLSHKASTSLLWSGHSPLSLAIASGNDLAVDVLLAWGANPNLPLSCRVGSALCANANIAYDCGTQPRNRMLLLEKLMKAGADILMPILVGEGRRCVMGTAVDYAYYSFTQDWRIAHTPYHALNPRERETLNARRQLLSIMGELLRKAATKTQQAALEDHSLGCCDVSPSETIMYTRARAAEENASTESISAECKEVKRTIRKDVFKYCYQCGRSVGVVLVPCSRCHEVLYCSKTCKMKAWNDRHKEECVRVQGPEHSEAADTQERVTQREHTASSKSRMAKHRETAVKTTEQPSLITQMKAHFKQKRIVEKLNKQRKVLAQKWVEKRHASGDQPKARRAGVQDQPKARRAGVQEQRKAPKKPPQTQLYDPKENYSYN